MENSFDEQQKLEMARKKVEDLKGFYKHLAAYVLVNIFLLVMSAANLDPGESFWSWGNFMTAICWGVGLLAHGLSVYGRNIFFSKDWEERKIKELMEKQKDRSSKWE